MARVDGRVVQIGDFVGFKSDIEQYGKIVKINGSNLLLKASSTFSGDYIGGEEFTTVDAANCWID
jgi:hypothetical protein